VTSSWFFIPQLSDATFFKKMFWRHCASRNDSRNGPY